MIAKLFTNRVRRMYLGGGRTVNFGASIVKYYDVKEGDVVIFFHNIGINPATIDAAYLAKYRPLVKCL